jgi:hypothetical protein
MPLPISVVSGVPSPHVIVVQTGWPRSIGNLARPRFTPSFMANQLLNQLVFCAPGVDLRSPLQAL